MPTIVLVTFYKYNCKISEFLYFYYYMKKIFLTYKLLANKTLNLTLIIYVVKILICINFIYNF